MKLEYLVNVNDHSDGIVRLYDFETQEIVQLCAALRSSVVDLKHELKLSSLNFIQTINCDLTLNISPNDKGISETSKSVLYCELTSEAYLKMIELIEPFSKPESTGFQWLYDLDSPIEFLLSKSGKW